MCSNLLYLITPTASAINTNEVLPLTTIARRKGCAVQSGTNSALLNKAGYYEVTATITFTAPVAGNATINLQLNGVNVTGATASTTIATETTEIAELVVNAIVRVYCNQGPATLTLVNSGIAINASNVSLSVKYLG